MGHHSESLPAVSLPIFSTHFLGKTILDGPWRLTRDFCLFRWLWVQCRWYV